MVIFYVLVVGFWVGILGVSIKFFNGEGGFRGRYPQNLGQDFFYSPSVESVWLGGVNASVNFLGML